MRWGIASEDVVDFIAHNLRDQDAFEVWLSDAMGPEEAVTASWKASLRTSRYQNRECQAILDDDGVPLGLCGVAGGGLIWFLATDGLFATEANRRQFVRDGKVWVDQCIERYGALSNWVFAKNVDSIRWLKSLGFTVYSPAPRGPSCALFSYFERRV
jgi:hypothetical protein